MQTKRGIELNIKESKYACVYNGIKFYFSSELYKNKFLANVETFIKIEELKLQNKYRLKLDIKEYLAIVYYKQIEKRGFYIYDMFGNIYYEKPPKFIIKSYIDN